VNYIVVVQDRDRCGGCSVSRMIIGYIICGHADKLSECCLLEDESAAYG
jgi:hypothetical protein